ncbi:MAG: PA14 domain-containing protein [candidate division FCPU426 bacterium]
MAKKIKIQSGLAAFLGALALGALGQALVWRPDSEWGRDMAAQSLAMPLGWLAFAIGGILLVRSWRQTQGAITVLQESRRSPRWLEAILLLLILGAAAGVRFHNLDKFPVGCFRDEGENGNVSIQIMNGEEVEGTNTRFPVYIEMHTQNATGYFYPTALFFKLFGITVMSERFVSVFFGILSVGAFYFLARWLFGVPLGLFLAACLAFLRWHVNFSRIGFLGMMTLFLEIPVFYFLLKGLKEKATVPLNLKKKGMAAFFGLAVALTVLRGFLSFAALPLEIENSLGLVMGLPLLYFVWKARKDPRSRALMLSAFALAIAMYSYIAARLLIVIVGLVVLRAVLAGKGVLDKGTARRFVLWLGLFLLGLALLVAGSIYGAEGMKKAGQWVLALAALGLVTAFVGLRHAFKEWLQPLGLALGLGLVVAGPLFAYSLSHFKEISARSDRVSIYNDKEFDKRPWGIKLLEEIPQTLAMNNVRGDGNPRHNLPGEIMLNPYWAAFFGLAMFYCLYRFRDERAWLVLAWWQVSLLAGYLSIEAPQAYRTIGAIPAVLIAVGLVLERGVVAVRRATAPKAWFTRTLAWSALALLLVAGAFYELNAYFVRQPQNAGVWAEFSTSEYLMGIELESLQKERPTHGLVRPDWSDSYTFKFATYPDRNYEYFDLSRHIPLKVAEVKDRTLFILGPAQLPLVDMLRSFYPKGQYHEQHHKITGELLYWSYLVTPEDVAAGVSLEGGLKGTYYQDVPTDPKRPQDGPHWAKERLKKTQQDPFLFFDWVVSPIAGFFSAEWHGSLKVAKGGSYHFWINSNSYGDLEIDGNRVVTQPYDPDVRGMAEGKAVLSPGRHRLRVRYYEARNYSRMELWWQGPDGRKEVVPSQALSPE